MSKRLVRTVSALAALAVPLFGAGPALDDARRALADELRGKGWIVYSARSDRGDWDLFLCRPDGSSVRNLTKTPEHHETAPQLSRDARRMLYRRLPLTAKIDGNHFGEQGELVLAKGDGTEPEAFGKPGEYAWASWSPDGTQIACLSIKGISFIEVATHRVVRTLERKGFFQQLTWSPDGNWLSGVANSFGTEWTVARMDARTGQPNAVSRVSCCTPDWFPDSKSLIFSSRPPGQKANKGYGWTELWAADAEGKERRLVYGEEGRHVYGGCISPDGKYVLFTGNVQENGDPGNVGAPMGIIRLADSPIIVGESRELRSLHPKVNDGPVLALPIGFEPCWTSSEIPAGGADRAAAPGEEQAAGEAAAATAALAAEVRPKGWIAFSAPSDAGTYDLFAMRPDGSDRRQITATADVHEAGVRFSPSGARLLFYRIPKATEVDNNTYGTFELVVAKGDASDPQVYGKGFDWAAWGPGEKMIACLSPVALRIVDLETRATVREIPRKGLVQQLAWSPDGRWFAGTANGLGQYWTIGRLDAEEGRVNAVSETDRYNCTPDWMPDSRRVIYSRGIVPDAGGFAELWVARGDGTERRALVAEKGRHLYGGCSSPDGAYILFTRSEVDLGKVDNSRTRMALMRRPAAAAGNGGAGGNATSPIGAGPILDLGGGWEPHWTYAGILGRN